MSDRLPIALQLGCLLCVLAGCLAALGGCRSTRIEGDADVHADTREDEAAVDSALDVPPDDAGEDADGETGCWDEDMDGYLDEACGGDDCDDGDPTIHPHAPEACGDGVDSNCDGLIGEPGEVYLIEPPAEVIHVFGGGNMRCHLIWTGSDYGIVWTQFWGGGIFLRRIDPLVGGAGEQIRLRDWQYGYTAIWNGSRYLLAWTQSRDDDCDVFLQSFDRMGSPLGEAVAVTDDGNTSTPVLVEAGDVDLLLMHRGYEADGDPSLGLQRIDGDGTPVGPAVDLFVGEDLWVMQALWVEDRLFVHLWLDDHSHQFATVSLEGEVLAEGDPAGLGDSGLWEEEMIPFGGLMHLFWMDGEWILRMLPLNGLLEPVGTVRTLSTIASLPVGAWTGTSLALMWNGVDPDGGKMGLFTTDVEPIHEPLTFTGGESFIRRRGIVWTGSELGMTWSEDGSDFISQRFARMGVCE